MSRGGSRGHKMWNSLRILQTAARAGILASALCPVTPSSSAPTKTYTFKREVPLLGVVVKCEQGVVVGGRKGALWAVPWLESDFFENLKWLKHGSRVQFRKNRTLATDFPDEVLLSVHFTAYRCEGEKWTPITETDRQQWIDKLQVTVAWKSGLEQRPVHILTPFRLNKFTEPVHDSPVWTLDARIDSKGLPLSDHLEVSIFDEHHRLLGRAASGLDTFPADFACCT